MSAHYLVRCTGCKAIIEQCRCPGPKVEREGRCNTCDTPDEIAALRSQLAAKDAEIEALKSKTPHTSCWAEIETLKARAEKTERERDQERRHCEDFCARINAAEARADRLAVELSNVSNVYSASLAEEKARAEKAEGEVDILKGVRNTWRAEVAAQKERYDVMAGKALAAEARAEKAEQERDEAQEAAQIYGEANVDLDERRRAAEARVAKLTEALREIAAVGPHRGEYCDAIAAAALEEK